MYIKELKCVNEFATSLNLQDFTIVINEEARPGGTHARTCDRAHSK